MTSKELVHRRGFSVTRGRLCGHQGMSRPLDRSVDLSNPRAVLGASAGIQVVNRSYAIEVTNVNRDQTR